MEESNKDKNKDLVLSSNDIDKLFSRFGREGIRVIKTLFNNVGILKATLGNVIGGIRGQLREFSDLRSIMDNRINLLFKLIDSVDRKTEALKVAVKSTIVDEEQVKAFEHVCKLQMEQLRIVDVDGNMCGDIRITRYNFSRENN